MPNGFADVRGEGTVAKSSVRRRRLLRIIGIICVSLRALYVLLCEVGFFRGVPVEPPDRITVYRDGQSAVFDRQSPEYRAIWSRLKPYGKSTLLDAMLGRLPEDQHNAALFGEQVESYLQYGTALRLSYDRKLAGPISGDPEDGWNELLYLLDYPDLPPEEPGCLLHPAHESGHMLLYETAECVANDLPHAFTRGVVNTRYPRAAAEYIRTLQLR